MDIEEVQKQHDFIEDLKNPRKIDDNLTIRVSFDRKKVRLILSDGSGCIELSKKQFLALQNYAFIDSNTPRE